MKKNNGNPKISVIMSVKDNEKSLSLSIESILRQTFTDWEFIICDDGSKDGTYKLLMDYSKQDDRIKILRNKKNMGLAYSLNRCIKESKSDILARQDADDFSEINRFEIQYDFVLHHPEYSIIGTSWNNVIDDIKIPYYPKNDIKAKDLIFDGGFMHPSWMMRKKDLIKIGLYTVNKNTLRDQDYHLVMKLYGAGMKMYNMPQILYNYSADIKTFNRTKSWKRVKGLMWVRFDGYKRNKFAPIYYLVVLKPFIKNILPTFITKKYYYNNIKKGGKK